MESKNEKYRFIKISADVLFEFIYEKFIEEQECYLEVIPTQVINTFAVDWEEGKFIFCAYKNEDENGNIKEFPKEISLDKLLKSMPDTTSTMFAEGRYKDYTKEQLLEIQQKADI